MGVRIEEVKMLLATHNLEERLEGKISKEGGGGRVLLRW